MSASPNSSEPKKAGFLETQSMRFANWIASAGGFVTGLLTLVVWLVACAIAGFKDPWPYATTVYISIATFLLVFLQRRTQRKQIKALHAKLDELIASNDKADNRRINIEEAPHGEILDTQKADARHPGSKGN